MGDETHSARQRGEGVGFCRIRRITGYLVGNLDRFNTAKRYEESDRISHSTNIVKARKLNVV